MKKVFIVAEIGCNHNGDKNIAKKMINEAKKCGVDAVKFQTFKAKNLISKYAPKAEYQKITTGAFESQLEMTKKLELGNDDYIELKKYAESIGLVVFSTPFDMDSIDFLNTLGQVFWKIPSGEVTNLPYLKKISRLKGSEKKIIVSTGMATIDEIKTCIRILTSEGINKENIIILHCNTEYPTPDSDVNLLAINDLKNNFSDMDIGFSDHSVGYVAAIGAVVLGVSLIEKHFTLDKNMVGPDHKASITPEELKELCINVRRMEFMVGSNKKIVTKSEIKNKVIARKSIVAACNIKQGEVFTEHNITCKRPGSGISPMEWFNVLGKFAEKDFYEDELITIDGFENQE